MKKNAKYGLKNNHHYNKLNTNFSARYKKLVDYAIDQFKK